MRSFFVEVVFWHSVVIVVNQRNTFFQVFFDASINVGYVTALIMRSNGCFRLGHISDTQVVLTEVVILIGLAENTDKNPVVVSTTYKRFALFCIHVNTLLF